MFAHILDYYKRRCNNIVAMLDHNDDYAHMVYYLYATKL